jgi:hypothetical protein
MKDIYNEYSEEWDAFYNPITNEWTESKCDDPTCHYCTNRPERPLEVDYHRGVVRGAEQLAREIDRELLENIKAGVAVTCDDTEGYSIGTRESYDEFVKNRNYDIEEKTLGITEAPGKNSEIGEVPPRK